MEHEKRIVELLADSLKAQDKIVEPLKESNQRLYKLELKGEKVEEQLIRLNLPTVENTRSIMQLADRVEVIFDHEKCISKLESIIIK